MDDNWVEPGWVDLEADVAVTIPSAAVLTAATNYGDPGALETLYHQNPGPYADEDIISFGFQSGMYLFGYKVPSATVTADAIGRFATLLSIGDLNITSSPLGFDLIASIGASEIPRLVMTFDNSNREWSKLLAREPILLAPVVLWKYYGGSNLRKVFGGQVTRIVLRGRLVEVEAGEP